MGSEQSKLCKAIGSNFGAIGVWPPAMPSIRPLQFFAVTKQGALVPQSFTLCNVVGHKDVSCEFPTKDHTYSPDQLKWMTKLSVSASGNLSLWDALSAKSSVKGNSTGNIDLGPHPRITYVDLKPSDGPVPSDQKLLDLLHGATSFDWHSRDFNEVFIATKVVNVSTLHVGASHSAGASAGVGVAGQGQAGGHVDKSSSLGYHNVNGSMTIAFHGIKFKVDKRNNCLSDGKIRTSSRSLDDDDALQDLQKLSLQHRRRALVIGNDAYQHIRRLGGAANDATKMRQYLCSIGFTVDDAAFKLDAKYDEMISAMDQFAKETQPGDYCVFFYAGHGSWRWHSNGPDGISRVQSELLLPVDFLDDEEVSNAVSDRIVRCWVHVMLRIRQASNVVLIFDSCHSGGMARDVVEGERFIDPEIRELHSLEHAPWPAFLTRCDPSLSADQADLNSGFRDDTAPWVLLAACGAEETARESSSNDQARKTQGDFTRALIEALLRSKISVTFHDLLRDIALPSKQQHPVATGNACMYFWLTGLLCAPSEVREACVKVDVDDKGVLCARGIGSALGIPKDTKFAVWLPKPNMAGFFELSPAAAATVARCKVSFQLPDGVKDKLDFNSVVNVVEVSRPDAARTSVYFPAEFPPDAKTAILNDAQAKRMNLSGGVKMLRVIDRFRAAEDESNADLVIVPRDGGFAVKQGGRIMSPVIKRINDTSYLINNMLTYLVTLAHAQEVARIPDITEGEVSEVLDVALCTAMGKPLTLEDGVYKLDALESASDETKRYHIHVTVKTVRPKLYVWAVASSGIGPVETYQDSALFDTRSADAAEPAVRRTVVSGALYADVPAVASIVPDLVDSTTGLVSMEETLVVFVSTRPMELQYLQCPALTEPSDTRRSDEQQQRGNDRSSKLVADYYATVEECLVKKVKLSYKLKPKPKPKPV